MGSAIAMRLKTKTAAKDPATHSQADVSGTHDHEGQSAETGDRLGRVFDLKIRIGRTKADAMATIPGTRKKTLISFCDCI